MTDDHLPTESRAGERTPGGSSIHPTDPPTPELSEQPAATESGNTHTRTYYLCLIDKPQDVNSINTLVI